MVARLLILIAYLLFIANLGLVLGLDRVNVLEKGAFLAVAVAYMVSRPLSKFVIGCLIACIAMIVLLGAATDYGAFSWTTLILSLNQVIIIYVLLAVKPSRLDRDFLFQVVAFIPPIAALLGVIYQAAGISPLFAREFATGLPRMAGSMIPAYMSAFSLCGTFAAVLLGTECGKPRYFVLAFIDLALLLLAGGRAALAVALICSAVAFVTSRSISPRLKFTGLIAGPALLALAFATVGRTAVERMMLGTDNGREELWAFTQSLADNHPVTGIGFGHQYWATPEEIKVRTGTTANHNDYIRLQAELGYYGMPIFYMILVAAVARAWWAGRRTVLPWVALAGFLFLSRSDNALSSPAEFMLIVLGVLANARIEEARPGPAVSKRAEPLWRRFPPAGSRRRGVFTPTA